MVNKERGRAFLLELEKLCREHDVTIAHEDGHGAFLLEEFDELNMRWLKDADYNTYFERT